LYTSSTEAEMTVETESNKVLMVERRRMMILECFRG
jgi:hypothetical protein